MAIEPYRMEVDGTTYILASLPASKGLDVAGHILSLIGDAAAYGKAEQAEGDQIKIDVRAAVAAVCRRMGEPRTSECVRILLSGLHKELPGKPPMAVNFETEFSKNYGVLTRLIAWALEFNFSSFLDAGDALSEALGEIKSALPKSTSAKAT